jgi:hypothetical protein
MIRREQLRLRRLFQRLALAGLAAPAAVQACSSVAPSMEPTDAGSTGRDAAIDAGATAPDGGSDGVATCSASPGAPYMTDASYAQLPESGADAPYYACYAFVDVPCTTATITEGCYLPLAECAKYCAVDGGFVDCLYWQDAGCDDGSVTAQPGQPAVIACGTCVGVGRRPAGLAASRAEAAEPLGAYFAEMAHLEAASVVAFARLAEELALHGAPRALVEAAERAGRDEVRHARVVGEIAGRFGGRTEAPRVRRRAPRSLERVARENAVEGCVRETYGAMVATWQASRARDPEVRRAMRRIAADETRHAALAWAVARWAEARLDHRGRSRVRRARTAAARALARDVARPLPASLAGEAGVPSGPVATALVRAMSDVWA